MSRRGAVNVRYLLAGLAIVVPLLLFLASGFGNDPHAVPDVRTGTPAPSFHLVDLDGKDWSMEELKGKPVVLNFWSTWCGPCKYEHPLLLQAAKAYPDVVFLGVIYSDEPDAVRRYLAQKGQAYPHLIDPTGAIAIDFGVTGVPESYFIDKQGVIVHKEAQALYPQTLQPLLARIRQ